MSEHLMEDPGLRETLSKIRELEDKYQIAVWTANRNRTDANGEIIGEFDILARPKKLEKDKIVIAINLENRDGVNGNKEKPRWSFHIISEVDRTDPEKNAYSTPLTPFSQLDARLLALQELDRLFGKPKR